MFQPGYSDSNPSVRIKIDPGMVDYLHFEQLPDYSRFLLRERISELAEEQQRLSRELKLPLLDHFSQLSDEQLKETGRQ